MLPESIPIPDFSLRIARRLEDAGYEVWCVGGVVRDVVYRFQRGGVLEGGVPGRDIDLATSARPDEVRRLFRRTVPIGIEHGTVAVLDRDNVGHEVTTFRKDVATDGRHAVVEFGVSLEEDLARRDFTVNAIAFHPLHHTWRDPHHGADDLKAGVIRAVGDPVRRFTEDHLRILRAVRFASHFDFEIDPETWDAAVRLVGSTRDLSAERVRDEWWKGLTTAKTVSGLVERWAAVGALAVWMPECDATSASWPARLRAAERLDGRDPVLITVLLSKDPAATFRRLRAPNVAIRRAANAAIHADSFPDPSDPVAVRRWLAGVGPATDDLLALGAARGLAGGLADAVEAERRAQHALTVGDLAITGTDLIAMGIPPGPVIGSILHDLLKDVLEHPEQNRSAWLRDRARELASHHGH